ncbi:MAG: hypothetical protein K6E61_07785 [Bacteroidales bacterium]|nr:hypothetical protein [Bacteroidales bacterium]
MKKEYYLEPQSEAVELTPGGAILTGSETEMSSVGIAKGDSEIVDFIWEE